MTDTPTDTPTTTYQPEVLELLRHWDLVRDDLAFDPEANSQQHLEYGIAANCLACRLAVQQGRSNDARALDRRLTDWLDSIDETDLAYSYLVECLRAYQATTWELAGNMDAYPLATADTWTTPPYNPTDHLANATHLAAAMASTLDQLQGHLDELAAAATVAPTADPLPAIDEAQADVKQRLADPNVSLADVLGLSALSAVLEHQRQLLTADQVARPTDAETTHALDSLRNLHDAGKLPAGAAVALSHLVAQVALHDADNPPLVVQDPELMHLCDRVMVDPDMPPGQVDLRDHSGRTLFRYTNVGQGEPRLAAGGPSYMSLMSSLSADPVGDLPAMARPSLLAAEHLRDVVDQAETLAAAIFGGLPGVHGQTGMLLARVLGRDWYSQMEAATGTVFNVVADLTDRCLVDPQRPDGGLTGWVTEERQVEPFVLRLAPNMATLEALWDLYQAEWDTIDPLTRAKLVVTYWECCHNHRGAAGHTYAARKLAGNDAGAAPLPLGLDGGACSSCQADMAWGVTKSGRRMPMDTKPMAVLRREHETALVEQRLPVYDPASRKVSVVKCYPLQSALRTTQDTLFGSGNSGHLQIPDAYATLSLAYQSHFATCPDADRHRRRK